MGLEFLKLGAAHIIPPEFPGGRDFNAFWDSWKNAPINPNTGRPYRAQQPFTALARGITGMGVKGNLADTLGNAIGIGRGRPEMPLARDEDIVLNSLYRASAINEKESSDYPIVSGDIDERRMFYRTLDSSFTPEERAQAEKELSELLNKEVTDQIGAVKASTGKTERQVQLELEAMKRYGWRERYDSQALDVQCAVIALSDQGGVRDNIIRQMITLLEHRPDGSIANFNDPEVIRRAIGLLELRMSRDPYYNIRIRDLRDKLRDRYLPRAEQTYGEFKAKRPAVEMQRTAVKNFLGI